MVVGMPMLASSASLAFWIGLCSAWNVPGVAAQMDRFKREEAAGLPAFKAFLRTYNADLIAKVFKYIIKSSEETAALWNEWM